MCGSVIKPRPWRHDDSLLQHRAEPSPGNRVDLIRDFNRLPGHIDGVTESVIEDDKGGDEVGAVRRFCTSATGSQRLAGHSDAGPR